MPLIWVMVGGALGSALRYGLGNWVQTRAGQAFPWGTLAVNVLGCLLIGYAMRAIPALHLSTQMRAFLTVGFAGGFTTFSTFGWEAFVLLESGHPARAFTYMLVSLALGMAAVFAGWLLAATLGTQP